MLWHHKTVLQLSVHNKVLQFIIIYSLTYFYFQVFTVLCIFTLYAVYVHVI